MEEAEPVEVPEKASIGMQMRGVDPLSTVEAVMTVEGPSVTFGGERWYIFQLTERILIIYRFYGDYIIIYYYYRVGDYNEPEPEPTPEPGTDCPYQPQFSDNQLIVRIEKHNNTPYYQSDEVYLYGYDTHGRIASYAYGENENNIYWIWTYRYDAEKVTAMLDDRMVFEGILIKMVILPKCGLMVRLLRGMIMMMKVILREERP